ncbi:MAG: hypothetical protein CMI53_03390 [Parcubacteria group bacterium]|jgi:hypothetical protein|nr:hypothetical protein [Parcubacteria group bacterium]|tara:strand:+ start:8880 stop:9521 length:642 start_codon:yes stop_codon:yes gene_type:complete
MENQQDWLELTNKIFNQDQVKAEAIFVHGWDDLKDDMIKLVALHYEDSGAKMIVLNGHDEYEVGLKGFEYWKEQLENKFSIPQDVIHSIGEADHTYAEAKGFMQFAKENNIDSAIIISTPQHIIRAFLTNLATFKKNQVNTKLYPKTLNNCNWMEEIEIKALASPPEVTTRLGRLSAEFARILNYRQLANSGDANYAMASFKEGLDYLKQLNV